MSRLKEDLKRFEKMLKESIGPFEASKKELPEIGEIRRFLIHPPLYFLISEETFRAKTQKIYEAIVLSEEVTLAVLSEKTPVFVFKNVPLVLVCLSFWIYLTEDFLFKYTEVIGKTDKESIEKCKAYAEKEQIPYELPEGEYIRLEMKRLSIYNTGNILAFIEALEEEKTKVKLSEEIRKILEEDYAYQLAATPKQVLKGKNWYGIVEKKEKKANLVLYLPQELIGKKVIIKLKQKVLFEGVVETDKIIIENLPLLSDYSFLEEELEFQV